MLIASEATVWVCTSCNFITAGILEVEAHNCHIEILSPNARAANMFLNVLKSDLKLRQGLIAT